MSGSMLWDEEDEYDPAVGSYRPPVRRPLPEPTPAGAELYDPESGSRALTSFSTPKSRSALEQLGEHQAAIPQTQKPAAWKGILAGALGGAAGYLNAGGRNRIDVEPALEGLRMGDYPRQMQNWQAKERGLEQRAKIEQAQVEEKRKQEEAEMQRKYYERGIKHYDALENNPQLHLLPLQPKRRIGPEDWMIPIQRFAHRRKSA